MHPRLTTNQRLILKRQDKLCICFIFDLKRLKVIPSFLFLKKYFAKFEDP